jgi:hypothetical protein
MQNKHTHTHTHIHGCGDGHSKAASHLPDHTHIYIYICRCPTLESAKRGHTPLTSGYDNVLKPSPSSSSYLEKSLRARMIYLCRSTPGQQQQQRVSKHSKRGRALTPLPPRPPLLPVLDDPHSKGGKPRQGEERKNEREREGAQYPSYTCVHTTTHYHTSQMQNNNNSHNHTHTRLQARYIMVMHARPTRPITPLAHTHAITAHAGGGGKRDGAHTLHNNTFRERKAKPSSPATPHNPISSLPPFSPTPRR